MIRLCTFASDITPPVGHPLCAGWYPPARAIGGPLQALGLILMAAGEPPVVLCALDWAELSNGDYDRWRADLARAVGTDPGRVAVHCTHAHDTPWPDRDAQDILDAHHRPDVVMAGDWAERARTARLQLPLRARYVIGWPHGVSGRFAPASEGRVEIASRSFVVDENGKRTAVVLPIEEYERLLEDLEDLALIAQRRNEPTESLATVAERLERKWQGEQSR